jgi:eukaryotic-like serine/threonine-protein kinase
MLDSVGHYKILDRIGAGGVGELYRARDTKLGRTVAVGVLSPETASNPERRSRFVQDARAAAALSHPNIAALYEVGEAGDLTYIVSEFVPGEPLTTTIANRSVSPRRAMDFATQLADALADAHAEGIAHRNLRSTAVTVTPKDKVKVLDFGLSAWTEPDAAAYTPPGTAADADVRADIAALGVVFYEMLTGRSPLHTAPAAPSSINANAPPELDAIVLKALSNSEDDRFESAATLAAEIRSVAAMLDVRSGDKEPPVLAPLRERKPRVAPKLIALVLLAAIAGLIWFATWN